MTETPAKGRSLEAYRTAVNACWHCGAMPDPDGDHSCPCPNRDGECPEHDTVSTFAEYLRRYQPERYERERREALTPEEAMREDIRAIAATLGNADTTESPSLPVFPVRGGT